MRRKSLLIVLILGAAFVASPMLLSAATGDIISEDQNIQKCTEDGSCNIEDIFLLSNSIIQWAVGISGSIALLMYVIGGVWMIFSQGNSSRIERGKDIIIGTTVSLIFILGGWLIVQFALESLKVEPSLQLTSNVCATDGQCENGQVCSAEGRCVERCDRDKKGDEDHTWKCQTLTACGFATPEDCEKNPQRCELNLCLSMEPQYVCCYTNE